MSYQIKETEKELSVIITDLQLHIQKPAKPKPWHWVAEKVARTGKPARAYTTSLKKNGDGKYEIVFPNEEYLKIKRAEQAGKKVRYFIPKQGVYMYPGKDLVEYLKAKETKVDKKIDTWHAK